MKVTCSGRSQRKGEAGQAVITESPRKASSPPTTYEKEDRENGRGQAEPVLPRWTLSTVGPTVNG